LLFAEAVFLGMKSLLPLCLVPLVACIGCVDFNPRQVEWSAFECKIRVLQRQLPAVAHDVEIIKAVLEDEADVPEVLGIFGTRLSEVESIVAALKACGPLTRD
jgi:hypothetical protein